MLVPQVRSIVPVLHRSWDIDRFLDDFFNDADLREMRTNVFPAWNVSEGDRSYRVEAELPGFARENLEIQVAGNELRLTGTREENSEEKTTVHHRERFSGTFSRTLRFNVPLDSAKVEATFKDGILAVTLPKSEAALPRKIHVDSAASN